jgi:ABC-type uncharacterized transport system permease subunit
MRVIGNNPFAAVYAGMNVKKNVLLSLFLAGGCGGLAGANEILGIQHRLFQGFASNYGFDGISVAILGGGTPIGILFPAVLFGALRSGGNSMQMFMNVPAALIYIIQALVIIIVISDIIGKLETRIKRKDL